MPLDTVRLDCVAGLAHLLTEKRPSLAYCFTSTYRPRVSSTPLTVRGHLCPPAFWEYNVPQVHDLTPPFAAGVRLKFQMGVPTPTGLVQLWITCTRSVPGGFHLLSPRARANGSFVATRAGALTRAASILNRWAAAVSVGISLFSSSIIGYMLDHIAKEKQHEKSSRYDVLNIRWCH